MTIGNRNPPEIDREAPASRPAGRNSGTQTWESLLFCHWAVDVEQLRSVIPRELEIDTFEGTAFIGVVPFKMRQIKPPWLPRQLAFNFLETNVRTYVVHQGKPGVYFLSLDASSRIAVWAARIGWSLPYFHSRMSTSAMDQRLNYSSTRRGSAIPPSLDVSFSIGQELGVSQPGSLEHFLLERYLLFVHRRGRIQMGHVHHEPYHAYNAEIHDWNDTLVAATGAPKGDGDPELSHYCHGVQVEVFGLDG